MPGKLFKSGSGLALIIPRELAERYQLKAGDLVETIPTERGLLVQPVEMVARLSKEWERALDTIVEGYRPALEKLGE